MRKAVAISLAALLGATLGCASSHRAAPTASDSPAAATAPREEAEGWPQPPPESPLARVRPGMSKRQVKELLGPPDDITSAPTGKAFIPFYFGNDARRTYFLYKGLGQVIFADGNVFGGGGNDALGVYYDPSEDGIADE